MAEERKRLRKLTPIRVKQLLTALRQAAGYSVWAKRPMSLEDCAKMYMSLCEVCNLLDIAPVKLEFSLHEREQEDTKR